MWTVVLGHCLMLQMTLVNASNFNSIFPLTILEDSYIVATARERLASEDQNNFDGHHLNEDHIGNTKDSLDVVGDTHMYIKLK